MNPETPPSLQPTAGPEPPVDHRQGVKPPFVRPGHPTFSRNTALTISLVVASILLLIAVGVAIWMFMRGSGNVVGNSISNQQVTDDIKDVKKVTFVPPANLPPSYVKREQNSELVTNTFYFDNEANCGITTGGIVLGETTGKTPKEAIVNSSNAAEALGVKTTKSTDGEKIILKDDGSKEYTFSTIELEQDVNVSGVAFKKQFNVVGYKQFGSQVASIGWSCKDETWPTRKPELEALAKAFTLKLER